VIGLGLVRTQCDAALTRSTVLAGNVPRRSANFTADVYYFGTSDRSFDFPWVTIWIGKVTHFIENIEKDVLRCIFCYYHC